MNSTTVFRDYGQEVLDAQYNNRARVPEHQDIHAGYQARAAAVVEEITGRAKRRRLSGDGPAKGVRPGERPRVLGIWPRVLGSREC